MGNNWNIFFVLIQKLNNRVEGACGDDYCSDTVLDNTQVSMLLWMNLILNYKNIRIVCDKQHSTQGSNSVFRVQQTSTGFCLILFIILCSLFVFVLFLVVFFFFTYWWLCMTPCTYICDKQNAIQRSNSVLRFPQTSTGFCLIIFIILCSLFVFVICVVFLHLLRTMYDTLYRCTMYIELCLVRTFTNNVVIIAFLVELWDKNKLYFSGS